MFIITLCTFKEKNSHQHWVVSHIRDAVWLSVVNSLNPGSSFMAFFCSCHIFIHCGLDFYCNIYTSPAALWKWHNHGEKKVDLKNVWKCSKTHLKCDKSWKKKLQYVQHFSKCLQVLPLLEKSNMLYILNYLHVYLQPLLSALHNFTDTRMTAGLSRIQHGFPVALKSVDFNVFYRIWLMQAVYFWLFFKGDI